MKIYCTLYRKTAKGLKVIGSTTRTPTITDTGLIVRPWYDGLKAGRYHLVHGLSLSPGPPTRLREIGEYNFAWSRDTITVTHRLDIDL